MQSLYSNHFSGVDVNFNIERNREKVVERKVQGKYKIAYCQVTLVGHIKFFEIKS